MFLLCSILVISVNISLVYIFCYTRNIAKFSAQLHYMYIIFYVPYLKLLNSKWKNLSVLFSKLDFWILLLFFVWNNFLRYSFQKPRNIFVIKCIFCWELAQFIPDFLGAKITSMYFYSFFFFVLCNTIFLLNCHFQLLKGTDVRRSDLHCFCI